jgi:hypothetical protein
MIWRRLENFWENIYELTPKDKRLTQSTEKEFFRIAHVETDDTPSKRRFN